MFACRDAVQLMTDAREGKLAGKTRFFYAAHMTFCFYCRRYRRQLEAVIAAAASAPPEPVDAATEDRLAAAFRARKKPSSDS